MWFVVAILYDSRGQLSIDGTMRIYRVYVEKARRTVLELVVVVAPTESAVTRPNRGARD
jgi:hypothetical protein